MRQVTFEYQKPRYSIDSVDNALRVIHILRDFGSVRMSDVAKILGVAESTAHRIMSMLVYQGFAVQDDHRRYYAGPALSAPVISSERTRTVQTLAHPVLEDLSTELGETVCLGARVGVHARVLLSVSPSDSDHVPERTGNVLFAHVSAAGRALLALLPDAQIDTLYRSTASEARGSRLSDADYEVLQEELQATRKRGFSRCVEAINKGISAIAVPVVAPNTPPVAIVVTTPTERLAALYEAPKVNTVFRARDELSAILRAEPMPIDEPWELIA